MSCDASEGRMSKLAVPKGQRAVPDLSSIPAELQELGVGCIGCVFCCRGGVPFMVGGILVLDLLIIAALAFLPCAHSPLLLAFNFSVSNAHKLRVSCTVLKIAQRLSAVQQAVLGPSMCLLHLLTLLNPHSAAPDKPGAGVVTVDELFDEEVRRWLLICNRAATAEMGSE